MGLQDRIQADLTAAMKARDRARTSALRLILAEMRNDAVARGRGPQGSLVDEEVELLLRREMKRRKESVQAFQAAGREDRAKQEEWEADLYASYLPHPLATTNSTPSSTRWSRSPGPQGHETWGAS